MSYRPDPGGVFPSDAHRHVLGHLPVPDDETSYSLAALHRRLEVFETQEPVQEILRDLEADGHAEQTDGLWYQTRQGFDALTGPIADEPAEGEEPAGPARLQPGPPQVHAAPVVPSAAGPSPRPRRSA